MFVEVPTQGRIFQEEIFGLVLAVLKVRNFQEALQIANNTEYGLTGAAYSSKGPQASRGVRRAVPGGERLAEQEVHGRTGGMPPLGRLQDVRHGHQGGPTRLPFAFHSSQDRRGEDRLSQRKKPTRFIRSRGNNRMGEWNFKVRVTVDAFAPCRNLAQTDPTRRAEQRKGGPWR